MAKATAFSIEPTQDYATVRDLAHRIWPVSYTHFLTPAQIDNMLVRIYDLDALRAEAAQGHQFFLAYAEGEPVGYASSYHEGEIAWLKKLYLLPSYRGTGVGAQLLTRALNHFAKTTEHRLLVNPENQGARKFYERMGFVVVGEKEVAMGDQRFTDVIYARRLCAP